MKTCSKCSTDKPLGEFYRQTHGRNGRTAACKACETNRKAMYKAEHAEKVKQQWVGATRRWRENHPEKYRVSHDASRDKWEAAHPEQARVIKQEAVSRHIARKKNAFVESVKVGVLLERERSICSLCGGKVKPEHASIDHIIPLSLGGEHSYRNCQLAHTLCNVRRQHRGPAQIRMLA